MNQNKENGVVTVMRSLCRLSVFHVLVNPERPKQHFLVKTGPNFKEQVRPQETFPWEREWMSWEQPGTHSLLFLSSTGALRSVGVLLYPQETYPPELWRSWSPRLHGPHIFMSNLALQLFGVLQALMWQS